MAIIGVITGDIVNSTEVSKQNRSRLLDSLKEIFLDIQSVYKFSYQIFRGDSFQIKTNYPQEVLSISFLIRTGFMTQTPPNSDSVWDVRLSVGIGELTYHNDEIILSDGEAFHLSGRAFDKIGKKRLVVQSCWEEVNNELVVSTEFVDTILSNFTKIQAQVVYLSILDNNLKQLDIALKLHKLPQYISLLVKKSQLSTLQKYLERCYQLISKEISKEQ